MKAADVADALRSRYPDDRYCTVLEAPLDAARQGTKIDMLAIGLWSSLKYELDAIEIKVSLGDFRREIERRSWSVRDASGVEVTKPPTRQRGMEYVDPESWIGRIWRERTNTGREHPDPWTVERVIEPDLSKSAEWREVAHRFWIACPVALAVKVEPLLPAGWGLYACTDGATQIVHRPAVNRDARPLTWRESIGLIRASADAGAACRARAFDKGARAAWTEAHLGLDEPPLDQHQLYRLPGRPL